VGDFYGTELTFGPVGITEKKLWAGFFMFSWAKKDKNIVVSAL
jgi:hypothetical protein